MFNASSMTYNNVSEPVISATRWQKAYVGEPNPYESIEFKDDYLQFKKNIVKKKVDMKLTTSTNKTK